MHCQFYSERDHDDIWGHIPANLVEAGCSLMDALVHGMDQPHLWLRLPSVLGAYLDDRPRGLLAHASLSTLDPVVVDKIACSVLRRAGWPQPPLLRLKDEAEFWAKLATRLELKVYADAIHRRLTPTDQQAFIRHVTARATA